MKYNRDKPDYALHHIPPQSIETEESLLSAILFNYYSVDELSRVLDPEDFYRKSHKTIVKAMLELAAGSVEAVNIVALTNHLRNKGKLEEVGGAAYISTLLEAPAVNFQHNMQVILEKSSRRNFISLINNTMRDLYESREEFAIIAAKFSESFAKIMKRSAKGKIAKQKKMSVENLLKHFSDSIETPFASLDDALGGFPLGGTSIVGANTGMGKTALVHCIVRHAGKQGKKVLYCATKMSEEVIYGRILAQEAKISFSKIENGRIATRKEIARLTAAEEIINAAPIYLEALHGEISLPDLRSLILGAQNDIGDKLDLVVVENLQEICWPGKKFSQGYKKDDFIASKIVTMSHDIGVHTIVSSQLKKGFGQDRRRQPIPEDLFGNDAKNLSKNIIFPWRPNYYDQKGIRKKGSPERDACLIVAKGGSPTVIPMTFWGDYYSWEERKEEESYLEE